MSLKNTYWRILEPVFVFKEIGTSPSNTYVGRSRSIDTVYQGTVVHSGGEIHDLFGGLYHVEADGTATPIRLTLPPHIFEAKYHSDQTSDQLKAMGDCVRLEKLSVGRATDYNAGREAAGRRMREFFGCQAKGDVSPSAEALKEAVAALDMATCPTVESWNVRDVGESIDATLRMKFADGTKIELSHGPRNRTFVLKDVGSTGLADAIQDEVGYPGERMGDDWAWYQEVDMALVLDSVRNVVRDRMPAPDAPSM